MIPVREQQETMIQQLVDEYVAKRREFTVQSLTSDLNDRFPGNAPRHVVVAKVAEQLINGKHNKTYSVYMRDDGKEIHMTFGPRQETLTERIAPTTKAEPLGYEVSEEEYMALVYIQTAERTIWARALEISQALIGRLKRG